MLRKSKVVVFVRHAGTCEHKEDENYPKCDCPKWLRWSKAGKQHRKPADTRTWGVAEQRAQELQESLNSGSPVKTEPKPDTMAALLKVYMADKTVNGIAWASEQKLWSQIGRFVAFMESRSRFYPQDMTALDITAFRATWDTWKSARTKSKAQFNIRGYVRFIGRTDLLESFSKIRVLPSVPMPFTEDEIHRLLSMVPQVFQDAEMASRVTALIHFMIGTGVAIRDTVQLEVKNIQGGMLRIKRQKTGQAVNQRLDAGLFAELMAVKNGNPRYVFLTGSKPENEVTQWVVHLRKVMIAAGVYVKGNLSHRFRDTFVDFSLGSGWSMTQVAAALGDSVAICELHYADLASKRMTDQLAALPVRKW